MGRRGARFAPIGLCGIRRRAIGHASGVTKSEMKLTLRFAAITVVARMKE